MSLIKGNMKTIVVTSLVLLGISSVVAITVDSGQPRALNRLTARAVVLSLSRLIQSIASTGQQHSPRSWYKEIEDDGNPFAYLRVWYFSPPRQGEDSCSTSPTISPALPSGAIMGSLSSILAAVQDRIMYYGYDFYTAVDGEFGIEYVLEETVDHRSVDDRQDVAQVVHRQRAAQAINADCIPFSNSLLSGNHRSLFYTLHSGSFLTSPNGEYTLRMESPLCKLVLKDSDSVTVWASPGSYTVDGCYAMMQLDCNLVVYTPFNVPVWASQTMACNGCVSSCVTVLQSDRNLVVYDSESRAALWASQTNV